MWLKHAYILFVSYKTQKTQYTFGWFLFFLTPGDFQCSTSNNCQLFIVKIRLGWTYNRRCISLISVKAFPKSNEVANNKQCHLNFCNKLRLSKFQHPSHNGCENLWKEMAKRRIEDKNQRFYSKNFYFNFYPLQFALSLHSFLFLHIFSLFFIYRPFVQHLWKI